VLVGSRIPFIFALYNFFLYNRYQIIKYTDSWAYTSDLANSIYARGELSNHCREVGIEYLRRTNKVEGKFIMPYQVSSYLMTGNFEKPVLVSNFKRRSDFSLSVMKQVSYLECFFSNYVYCFLISQFFILFTTIIKIS
jgi:hypothetical protein